MQILRRWLPLLPIVALVVACGSSGGTSQPSGATEPPAGTPPPGGATQPAGGGGGVPSFIDTVFTSGTLHLEVTGDTTATIDLAGAGAAASGALIMNYTGGTPPANVALTISPDGSGMSLQVNNMSTAGGSDPTSNTCTFTVSKNDTTGAAGEFSCPSLDAIELGTNALKKLVVRGAFTAAP